MGRVPTSLLGQGRPAQWEKQSKDSRTDALVLAGAMFISASHNDDREQWVLSGVSSQLGARGCLWRLGATGRSAMCRVRKQEDTQLSPNRLERREERRCQGRQCHSTAEMTPTLPHKPARNLRDGRGQSKDGHTKSAGANSSTLAFPVSTVQQ